jgi:hypothetical protein
MLLLWHTCPTEQSVTVRHCSFTFSVLRLSSLAQQCNNCWIAAERIQFSFCISFHLLVTLECFLRNDSSVVWKWIGKTFPAKLLQSVIATRTVWGRYLGEWPLSLSRAGTLHPEGFPHLLQCRTVAACFLLLRDIENAGGSCSVPHRCRKIKFVLGRIIDHFPLWYEVLYWLCPFQTTSVDRSASVIFVFLNGTTVQLGPSFP